MCYESIIECMIRIKKTMNTNDPMTVKVETGTIKSFGVSDRGKKRPANEDAIHIDAEGKFMLLADGMGGHERGAEASSFAIQVIRDGLDPGIISNELEEVTERENIPSEILCYSSLLHKAISKANTIMFERNQKLKLQKDMGTTIVGIILIEKSNQVVWFHIGDSRLYRFRNSMLQCLTEYHSAYMEWLKNGKEGPRPGRNIITRAIGPFDPVKLDIKWATLNQNDTYILCSDGLTNMLNDDQIESLLNKDINIEIKVQHLVEAANKAGGKDNISVVGIEFG